MDRMKTFGIYLLIFVGFYIFSTICAYFYLQSTYTEIDANIKDESTVKITIEEANATIINGYIKGNIENTTNEAIQSKYVQINLISSRGNLILTKYLYVDEIKPGEVKDFNLSFRAENIKSFEVEITEEVDKSYEEIEILNIADSLDGTNAQWMTIWGAFVWMMWAF